MACKQQLLSLLSERGLAATVRSHSQDAEAQGENAWARLFTQGPPPRAITELVAENGESGNAGSTSLACRIVVAAVRRENPRIAWADPLDRWDPDSAQAAGVVLDKVLWLRGSSALAGMAGLSRWHEILGLLIQAGGLDLVVADFSSWPKNELRRTPRSAWFRLLRGLERSRRTALLLLAPEPLTQSCAALVVGLAYGSAQWPQVSRQRLRHVAVRGRLLRQRFSDPAAPRPQQSEAVHLPLELRA